MKNREDWDDGRTVADMSGVTRPHGIPRPAGRQGEKKEAPKEEYSPGERRWAILGALRATLLIALIYLGGLALVILLLLRIWKA